MSIRNTLWSVLGFASCCALAVFAMHDPAALPGSPATADAATSTQLPGATGHWIPLAPRRVASSKKDAVEILADQSIQFEFPSGEWREPAFHFRFEKLGSVHKVRLQILANRRFHDHRVGQEPASTVMLFDLKPTLVRRNEGHQVLDFFHCEYPVDPDDDDVGGLIDYASDTGWKVPHLKNRKGAIELVFTFDPPITVAPDDELIFDLDAGGGDGFDAPARVRFSFARAAATKGRPASDAEPTSAVLQEMHDLLAQRTRVELEGRYVEKQFEADPSDEHRRDVKRIEARLAEIARRLKEIHQNELGEFQQVAQNAGLECSEEPMFGQPSYGIILYATATRDIEAGELLLFHADGVYRTTGEFQPLTTSGEGWFFRPNASIRKGAKFVVACIQDAPEEIENVKRGFMPNSDRARDPARPYTTRIFDRAGKPFDPSRNAD